MKNIFMVVKLKDIIKKALIAIVIIIILITFISFFTRSDKDTNVYYNSGTYTSAINVDDKLINLEVTIHDGKIKNLSLINTEDSIPVFFPLFETVGTEIFPQIISKQTLDIKTPDDAEITSEILIDNIKSCLKKAEK